MSSPTIVVANSWSEVSNADRHLMSAIRKELSYPVPNRKERLIGHVKKKHGIDLRRRTFEEVWDAARHTFPNCWACYWDWQESLLSGTRFPTGLLPLIRGYLNAYVVDRRVKPAAPPIPHKVELRDYQRPIVEAGKRVGQGIIEMATGAGKTPTGIALAHELGLRTLVVVPTTAIFNEWMETWGKYCEGKPGIIAGKTKEVKHITIAIFASHWAKGELGKRLAAETDCLIVDEGHKAAAETWYNYLLSVNAFYRFGLTATPFRDSLLEDMRMFAVTGPKFATVDTQTLQKLGHLARAVVTMVPISLPRLPWKPPQERNPTDHTEHYRRAIALNPQRNGKIIEAALSATGRGEKVLIIVRWDKHGQILKEAIGDVVYFVGGTSAKKMRELKEQFQTEKNIAIGTPCVDLGFNVPTVDTLIMAGGGRSKGQTQQRLGRALRVAPGKEYATVLDFTDDDQGVLRRQAQARVKVYQELGQEVRFC